MEIPFRELQHCNTATLRGIFEEITKKFFLQNIREPQ